MANRSNYYPRTLRLQSWEVQYYKKGLDHGKLEKYQEAIENFNKAIELDPNSVAFYFARGDVYEILKKYEEAINDYDEAIELDPDNSYCYCNRGIAYEKMGEYQEAINDYNKAIELDSNCKIAIENLKKLKNF